MRHLICRLVSLDSLLSHSSPSLSLLCLLPHQSSILIPLSSILYPLCPSLFLFSSLISLSTFTHHFLTKEKPPAPPPPPKPKYKNGSLRVKGNLGLGGDNPPTPPLKPKKPNRMANRPLSSPDLNKLIRGPKAEDFRMLFASIGGDLGILTLNRMGKGEEKRRVGGKGERVVHYSFMHI
jgi:hypothetical protein